MNEMFPLPLQMGENVFHWVKRYIKSIEKSVHITKYLTLGMALNIYINHLMFYPSRQNVK